MRTDDEMDDLIDKWHESEGNQPLHEFLGMTWEQYAHWVEGKGFLLEAKRRCKDCGDDIDDSDEWWGRCVGCAKKDYESFLHRNFPPLWSTDDMFDGVPEDMAVMIATFCSRQQTGHCTCARLVDIWRGEDPILLAEKRGADMYQLREKFERLFHGE
jgi:hypothetical protein